jgi:hypothetical protein
MAACTRSSAARGSVPSDRGSMNFLDVRLEPRSYPRGRTVTRRSRRGNRRLNHAVHMAAVTQIRFRQSEGRAYYDRKIKEGKSHKEALRCLKRRVSDAIFAHLVADAKRKAKGVTAGPGGQRGNGSVSSVAGSHPERQLFGQATPGPVPTIGPGATRRSSEAQEPVRKKSRRAS